MATPSFLMGFTLKTASSADGGNTITFSADVKDYTGVYLGTNAAVGDILLIDTSGYLSGTVTAYKILTISKTATTISGTASFISTNHAAPDISASSNTKGIIARPSTNRGTLPTVARGVQDIPEFIQAGLLNYNSSLVE
jgi:hypothetical protein